MSINAIVEPHSARGLYHDLALASADSIRILYLLPGQWNEEVQVVLRVVCLSSNPEYEALSYTWGSALERHTINVNSGNKLPVTDNLFRALRNLRGTSETRPLWVDAICINQADFQERRRQVKIMGSIYQAAACVDVWLGECSTALARRFGPISTVLNAPVLVMGQGTIQKEALSIKWAMNNTKPPWHRRAWTIQEFILAKQAFLCTGTRRILVQADKLDATSTRRMPTNVTRSFNRGLEVALRIYLTLPQPDAQRDISSLGHQELSILSAPQVLGEAESTDKRDMVYCLLGLINSDEAELIDIDYTMPCSEVFAQATYASIKTSSSFQILEYARLFASHMPGLPTWSVNFASLPYRNMDDILDNQVPHSYVSRKYDRFISPLLRSDSGYSKRVAELEFDSPGTELDPSNNFLTISGIRCDEIAETTVLTFGNMRAFSTERVVPPTWSELRGVVRKAVDLLNDAFHAGDGVESDYLYSIKLFRDLAAITSIDIRQIESGRVKDRFKWANVVSSFHITDSLEEAPDEVYRSLNAWMRALRPQSRNDLQKGCANVDSMWWYAIQVAGKAVLFATKAGLIGFGPGSVGKGDILVLVRNSWPFMVLRPVGERFQFRGFVYIHGFMDSSFWGKWTGEGFREETFVLE